jgi:hypothetical protein
MSSLAANFNNAIHQQLRAYAAWIPIVNTYKIGDYGFFEGGVFQSIGNVKEKYPEINLKIDSGAPAEIDFTSSNVRTLKLDASGNAVTSFAALGNAEASLKFVFEGDNSNLIKAELTSEELKNVDEVASVLANKREWRNKFSVVSKIYKGEHCVIICSREAGTEVQINATADVLKQIEGGKVQGGFDLKTNKNSVFKAIGESGVVALSLFKLNIFDNVKILRGESNANEQKYIPVEGVVADDFIS